MYGAIPAAAFVRLAAPAEKHLLLPVSSSLGILSAFLLDNFLGFFFKVKREAVDINTPLREGKCPTLIKFEQKQGKN